MSPSNLIRLRRARRRLLRALGAGLRPSKKTKILVGLLIFFVSFTTKSLMAVDLAPSIYASAQASGRWEFERDATSIFAAAAWVATATLVYTWTRRLAKR